MVGGIADVLLNLANDGFAMAGPTVAEVVLSADDQLDPGDLPLDRVTIPAFGEGAWETVPALGPIPPDIAAGNYHLFAIIDPDETLPEIVEENNVSPPLPITVRPLGCVPDQYEEDDRAADANPIQFGVPQQRNHCEDAHDWLSLEAQAGESFTIEVTGDNASPRGFTVRVIAPSGVVVTEQEETTFLVVPFTVGETGVYRFEVAGQRADDYSPYTVEINPALPTSPRT